MTFQYSLWDRLKTLDSLTPTNLINLRKLCCHLITKKALSLSILKVSEKSLFSRFLLLVSCWHTDSGFYGTEQVWDKFLQVTPAVPP